MKPYILINNIAEFSKLLIVVEIASGEPTEHFIHRVELDLKYGNLFSGECYQVVSIRAGIDEGEIEFF